MGVQDWRHVSGAATASIHLIEDFSRAPNSLHGLHPEQRRH